MGLDRILRIFSNIAYRIFHLLEALHFLVELL